MKPYRHAYLELTNCCNFNCSFCPPVTRPRQFVETKHAIRWIDQIAELSDGIYWHVQGEPLLHPDFTFLAHHAASRGLQVKLTTNGSKICEFSEQLLSGDFTQINFSMQALGELTPENRQRIEQDIFHFTEQALTQRPELFINYRWWQNAKPDVSRAARYFNLPPDEWRAPSGRHSKKISGRLYASYASCFEWPDGTDFHEQSGNDSTPGPKQGSCRGLIDQFAILCDGRVTACCLDASGALTLGSAHTSTIRELLESQKATWLAEGFRRREMRHPVCQKCGFATRF